MLKELIFVAEVASSGGEPIKQRPTERRIGAKYEYDCQLQAPPSLPPLWQLSSVNPFLLAVKALYDKGTRKAGCGKTARPV